MNPATSASGNSGAIALFAVASMLLAFFVALNAMSVRDPSRARDVAGSFASRSRVEPGPVTIIAIAGDVLAVKVVERRWLDLFPGAGMAPGQDLAAGRVLRAELGVAGIFAPGLADSLPSARSIVAALARIVAEAPADLDLSLDVKLGLAAGDQGDALALSIQRARSIARLLGTADAAGNGVSVRLQRGRPGVVALELRLAARAMPVQPIPAQARAARPGG